MNFLKTLRIPALRSPQNFILVTQAKLSTSQCNFSTEDPFKRTMDVFKNDFIDMKNTILNRELTKRKKRIPTFCDVLIIGGGVMGSSIAYWLKQRVMNGLEIVVVEKDPTVKDKNYMLEYQKCSTTLSVGGLRQQFSLKENIELSMASAEFLRNIKHHLNVEGTDPPDIQFHPCGYLFLASDESAQILKDNADLQKSLGAKVELISPETLKERYPWMNTQGISLACHGLENEGWFDPWSLLSAFKRKAIDLGAHFISGDVEKFGFEQSQNMLTEHGDPNSFRRMHEAYIKFDNGEEMKITFSLLVIAAGCSSGHIGNLAGIGKGTGPLALPLPVEPRKRYVYNVHCPDGPGLKSPFVIDNSGAYVRREGLAGHFLVGMSPPLDCKEPCCDDLDVDYNFFENFVWPSIANRIPAFEKCKVKSAWAGFYDYNYFDENAFIGPHPGFYNVYLATGFSGHGIQQAPAVGRAIMELIVDGFYVTTDLTRLEYHRYLEREPLWESNIV